VSRAAVPWTYRPLFVSVARATGQDENLLHALAWQESRMDPAAVSPANENGTRDYGLMQINEVNLAALGLDRTTALDPARSVAAAAQYLQQLEASGVHGLADLAAAYNAGAVKRTADGAYVNARYVAEVLTRYAWVQLAALGTV
jgi:soluble lytic murein transglycosylase-like protein